MGQTYNVECRFKFKNDDPSSFCKAIRDAIKENVYKAKFHLENKNLNDPYDCFLIATCDRCHGKTDDGIWYSSFDATYSWESVMYDIFEKALKELDDGSFVEIWPDSGVTKMTVKNGKVIIK